MAASQPNCALPPFPECAGVQFAHVPNWPGYAASDDGHVWSCHAMDRDACGRIIKTYGPWWRMSEQLTDKGYYVVYITQNGKRRRARVHILVLESFVGLCPPGMEACHDPDRTRTNNRLSNLRWDTRARNHADKVLHGTSNRGSRHGIAKLTEIDVLRIASGEFSGWRVRDIASALGVGCGTIAGVMNGKTWSHITGIKKSLPQERSKDGSLTAAGFIIDSIANGMKTTKEIKSAWSRRGTTVHSMISYLSLMGVVSRLSSGELKINQDALSSARMARDSEIAKRESDKQSRIRHPVRIPRSCEACNKDFIAKKSSTRYCCVRCRYKASQTRQIANRAHISERRRNKSRGMYSVIRTGPLQLVCVVCGSSFGANRNNAKYCSIRCIRKHFNTKPKPYKFDRDPVKSEEESE